MSTQKPKVLLFFHHFRTPKDMGGLRSWHIGKKLVEEGYDVEAIVPAVDTLSGGRRWKNKFRIKEREGVDGVKVTWTGALSNNRKSKVSRVFYFLSASLVQGLFLVARRRPDIVIATSLPISSLLISFIYSKVIRVPFVVDVRDTHLDSALATGVVSRSWASNMLLKLEGWVFRKASLNIPVTKGMDQLLLDKGVDEESRAVVPLGFDGRDVYEGCVDWSRDVRAELGLEGKFVALYSGTLGYVFDIETILEAARKVRDREDIVFLFLGGGQQLNEFAERARSEGINALFLGPRPKADVPLFCKQADVALYAVPDKRPLKAIMGNKVFDYLGNGTPIINASQGGDVDDIISRSGGGVSVASGDSSGMAEWILEFARNEELKALCGERAESFVNSKMTASHQMVEFEKAIRPFVESKVQ